MLAHLKNCISLKDFFYAESQHLLAFTDTLPYWPLWPNLVSSLKVGEIKNKSSMIEYRGVSISDIGKKKVKVNIKARVNRICYIHVKICVIDDKAQKGLCPGTCQCHEYQHQLTPVAQ